MTIQRDSQERFDVLVTPVVGEDPGVAVEMIDGKWLVVFGYPSYQTAILKGELHLGDNVFAQTMKGPKGKELATVVPDKHGCRVCVQTVTQQNCDVVELAIN